MMYDFSSFFFTFVVKVGVVCFALGFLVAWGAPVAWDWLKPIIHGWTA